MVLGVDWMKGVNPISFDFNCMEVSFKKEGKRMTITGGRKDGMYKLMTGKKLRKVMKGKWAQWAQLFSIVAKEDTTDEHDGLGQTYLTINSRGDPPDQVTHLALLNELLVNYEDLFAEPKSLPPNRPFDHSITLKRNTEPVNIKAYRYPPI